MAILAHGPDFGHAGGDLPRQPQDRAKAEVEDGEDGRHRELRRANQSGELLDSDAG